jgi:hypothetical protein
VERERTRNSEVDRRREREVDRERTFRGYGRRGNGSGGLQTGDRTLAERMGL